LTGVRFAAVGAFLSAGGVRLTAPGTAGGLTAGEGGAADGPAGGAELSGQPVLGIDHPGVGTGPVSVLGGTNLARRISGGLTSGGFTSRLTWGGLISAGLTSGGGRSERVRK